MTSTISSFGKLDSTTTSISSSNNSLNKNKLIDRVIIRQINCHLFKAIFSSQVKEITFKSTSCLVRSFELFVKRYLKEENSVETLVFDNTGLTPTHAECLSEILCGAYYFKRLTLINFTLSLDTTKVLCSQGFYRNTSLVELTLCNVELTDEKLALFLSELHNHSGILFLDVSRNPLKKFNPKLALPNLRELYLDRTHLSKEECFEAIRTCNLFDNIILLNLCNIKSFDRSQISLSMIDKNLEEVEQTLREDLDLQY